MRFARPLALVVGLLSAFAGRPAEAKLDPAQWRDAESRFRSLFAEAGKADAKQDALKVVLGDGEPRVFSLVADGLVLEASHCGRIADNLSGKLAALQVFLAKKDDDWRPGEENQMLTLQTEVGTLEKARADEEKVLKAVILATSTGGEAMRKAVLARCKGSTDWSVRASGMRVAGGAPEEAACKAMLQGLEAEKDPRVRLAAVDALSTSSGVAWHPYVVGLLDDPDWSVQVLAARVAGAREMGRAIQPLIQALAKASPRVAEEIVAALRKLTHQTIEPYADVWAKWWAEHRLEFGEDGRPLNPVVAQPRASDIEFYGLKIKSDKILFVLDTSDSMKYEIKNTDPNAGKVTTGEEKPKDPKFSGPKIEVAKQQLHRAIELLPKGTLFNIIAFNHSVRQWQPKMMAATPENKETAYAWFRNEPPKGSTYIDGALRMAFKLAGTQAVDKAYSPATVDTIVFLTDGAPTDNSLKAQDMDPEEILQHVREWNAQKQVVIHCVGVDNVVKGIWFLKKLAAENGGTYVDG